VERAKGKIALKNVVESQAGSHELLELPDKNRTLSREKTNGGMAKRK